jgi:hypothetical protein
MTNMTGSKLSIFSQVHFHIEAGANMGLDFVSGQYGCLFSRCRKYVINSLIHGHFHIGLVIIPRPILALDSISVQYGGLRMITRPIWKCHGCINLYVLQIHVLENSGRYWDTSIYQYLYQYCRYWKILVIPVPLLRPAA